MRTKKTESPQQRLEKQIEALAKQEAKFMSFCNRIMKSLESKMKDINQKVFESQRAAVALEKIRDSNENVEESLCNVLLAIRQNEYLQAWYPPQHGFDEMKVTGIHPAKLKKVVDGGSKG